jgi:transposase-like protein
MTIDLTAPEFRDEDKARAWLEQARWPNGVNCPHCGSLGVIRLGYEVPKVGSKNRPHRPGLFHCRDCRGQFTVCTGHVMESSHVKLAKWVLAIRLMTSSKKGMSAHQLHRSIHVTYKTAWFMFHRLREGLSTTDAAPVGGDGKIVEADEAYHGRRKTPAVLSRGRVAMPTK